MTLPRALALLLLLSACAVRASVHLHQAEQAVALATEQGAEEHAPYEYTLALRHLEKAREEAWRGQHRTAEELAREAVSWAERASRPVEGAPR